MLQTPLALKLILDSMVDFSDWLASASPSLALTVLPNGQPAPRPEPPSGRPGAPPSLGGAPAAVKPPQAQTNGDLAFGPPSVWATVRAADRVLGGRVSARTAARDAP